ncbi:MAG TPA: T9SS type A sorting domain-containing protein, partial [bacterium]|nr:T9SS type A sorting domain-containing protein [bacterium]
TTWTDSTVQKGECYTWRVRAARDSLTSLPGNEVSLTLTSVRGEGALPLEYSLSQNWPNPFNPSTRIAFSLPRAEWARIALYDLLGREVRILLDQEMAAGHHQVGFEAGQLAGGVYICRMHSGDFIAARKMILMK